MRSKNHTGSLFDEIFNRGQGGPYSSIIRNLSLLIERYIKIRPNQYSFSSNLHIFNAFFVHTKIPFHGDPKGSVPESRHI